MWNPETYRDTDFGLEPDETFEPAEPAEDDDGPAAGEPYIQTVLGPIRPDEAGVMLVGEHLQWAPPAPDPDQGRSPIGDARAMLVDLEAFFTVAGRTVVSATPRGAGRDARVLLRVAQRAPVHIVAATGFHFSDYRSRHASDDVASRMREELERDLTHGLDGTAVFPGVVVVPTGTRYSDIERHALNLASDAHRRFGLPVLARPEPGMVSLRPVELLASSGVPAGSVILTCDDDTAADTLRDIAESGAYLLLFGSLDGQDSDIDRRRARRIASLFAAGRGDRILVSHGFTRRDSLLGYGGRPGLPYIVEQFAVMLMEAGLGALDVRQMLIDNAAAAIAVRHRGATERA